MTQRMAVALLFAMSCWAAVSQPNAVTNSGQANEQQSAYAPPVKAEVLHLIVVDEAEARNGEIAHADLKQMAKIYTDLGDLYARLGMYLKAEDAMKLAVADLRNGPRDELAEETEHLAVLLSSMGSTRRAERDYMQALQIRKSLGDSAGIALAEADVAGFYNAQKKFKKSEDYARRAFEVIGDRPDVSMQDRVAVRWALGNALIGLKNCAPGIAILKESVELGRNRFGEGTRQAAYAEYELGSGYWHCGDRELAAEWLKRGTTGMKDELGWPRTIYLNAMSEYAQFLRENGQPEEAASAEAVVHQGQSVVDVQALAGRSEGFQSEAAQKQVPWTAP
jgi:tetratricopeptide (TPR) repeat protein